MMSEKIKLSFFNPVDHMTTDEEMINYLIDCYFEDPDGQTYKRACEFLGASKDISTSAFVIYRATKEIIQREVSEQRKLETGSKLSDGLFSHA